MLTARKKRKTTPGAPLRLTLLLGGDKCKPQGGIAQHACAGQASQQSPVPYGELCGHPFAATGLVPAFGRQDVAAVPPMASHLLFPHRGYES